MSNPTSQAPIETYLNCQGYYGFGGGWLSGKDPRARSTGSYSAGSEVYCGRCSLKQACWEAHRERVAGFFPDAVAEFERRAETTTGPELMKQWYRDYETARRSLYVGDDGQLRRRGERGRGRSSQGSERVFSAV